MRILNAANSRVMTVELPDVSAWICAKDGQSLAQPYILQDALTLAPAERYDLIVDIRADWQGEKPIYEVSTKQRFAGAYWEVSASAEVITRNSPARLPENPLIPLSDEKPAHFVQLMMEGGAAG